MENMGKVDLDLIRRKRRRLAERVDALLREGKSVRFVSVSVPGGKINEAEFVARLRRLSKKIV